MLSYFKISGYVIRTFHVVDNLYRKFKEEQVLFKIGVDIEKKLSFQSDFIKIASKLVFYCNVKHNKILKVPINVICEID